jgi:histidinol-phosphate aminotransferase
MSIQNLIRPNIKMLKPYASARDEFQGTDEDIVFLDANENPFENGVNRYPDPQQRRLKKLLSGIKNISVDNILLGNGSDEVLDLIFRVFCEANTDNIITLPPTYGMYEVLANINAVEVINVQLSDDFQPRVDQILKASNDNTKILFLCSPNNPTGNSFSPEKMERLLLEFKGVVVIDEAYIDFSEQQGWLNRLEEFPNLIITQTLSKAYGMAGIRLGICYASKEIIVVLNKIKPPYNINALTQQWAFTQLTDANIMGSQVESILKEREILIENLKPIGFIKKIYPSDANFILIKVDDANKRYAQIIDQGVVIRNRTDQPLCRNCLRLTIGTSGESKKLLEALLTISKSIN